MTQATLNPPANGLIVQRVTYQPLAPIGSANALKSLMEAQREGLASMLPRHITPERLFKTLLVAANRNPDILRCTQASILETINRAAELGLDLSGTLGEAYPVPFNNKVKTRDGEQWLMQLQLIIGYRGLEKLAWQSGEVESIDAEVVYANDPFVFKKGTEVTIEWQPCLKGERGEVLGAYACVKMKGGGKLARFLTKGDIDKIRGASKSKDSPAWRNWWDEMARKCALKRTLKDAPLSTEKLVRAMEHDARDSDLTDVLSAMTAAATPGQSRAQALLGKITGRPVSEGQVIEPDPDALALAEQDAAREAADTIQANAGADPASETAPEPADAPPPTQATEVGDEGEGLTLTRFAEADLEERRKMLFGATKDAGYSRKDLEGWLFKFTLAHAGGKADKLTPEKWVAAYEAVKARKIDVAKGTIGE